MVVFPIPSPLPPPSCPSFAKHPSPLIGLISKTGKLLCSFCVTGVINHHRHTLPLSMLLYCMLGPGCHICLVGWDWHLVQEHGKWLVVMFRFNWIWVYLSSRYFSTFFSLVFSTLFDVCKPRSLFTFSGSPCYPCVLVPSWLVMTYFMTISFYCYLSLILRSHSFI